MIPVDQVRTGYGRGQCTEATFASLLEVPLEAVPDLWAGPDVPPDAPPSDHQPLANLQRLWAWLREHFGLVEVSVQFPVQLPVAEAWRDGVDVLAGQGIVAEGKPWARFHGAAGPNPDGVSHILVAELGQVVHDPNPRRRGIVSCDAIVWLVPLTELPEHLRDPSFASISWRLEVDQPSVEVQTCAHCGGGPGNVTSCGLCDVDPCDEPAEGDDDTDDRFGDDDGWW